VKELSRLSIENRRDRHRKRRVRARERMGRGQWTDGVNHGPGFRDNIGRNDQLLVTRMM